MKPGQTVKLVSASGDVRDAIIDAVVGTGRSLFKKLALRVIGRNAQADGDGDEFMPRVVHRRDAKPGDAFWVQAGEDATPLEPPHAPKPRSKK
jgi:hypothetical protein